MAKLRIVHFVIFTAILTSYIPPGILEDLGNFKPIIREVKLCPDSGTEEVKFINPRLVRVDRNNQNVVTTLVSTVALDETVDFYVEIAIWGNGGWKKNFFRLDEKNAFNWLADTLPGLAEAMYNQSGVAGPPIPPGTYEYDIPVSNLRVTNAPPLPFGKFDTQIYLVKDDHVITCLRAVVETIQPTKRRRPKKKKN